MAGTNPEDDGLRTNNARDLVSKIEAIPRENRRPEAFQALKQGYRVLLRSVPAPRKFNLLGSTRSMNSDAWDPIHGWLCETGAKERRLAGTGGTEDHDPGAAPAPDLRSPAANEQLQCFLCSASLGLEGLHPPTPECIFGYLRPVAYNVSAFNASAFDRSPTFEDADDEWMADLKGIPIHNPTLQIVNQVIPLASDVVSPPQNSELGDLTTSSTSFSTETPELSHSLLGKSPPSTYSTEIDIRSNSASLDYSVTVAKETYPDFPQQATMAANAAPSNMPYGRRSLMVTLGGISIDQPNSPSMYASNTSISHALHHDQLCVKHTSTLLKKMYHTIHRCPSLGHMQNFVSQKRSKRPFAAPTRGDAKRTNQLVSLFILDNTAVAVEQSQLHCEKFRLYLVYVGHAKPGPQVVDGNREEADGDPPVRFLMITFHDLGPRDLEMIGCVLQFNLTPISTCFRGSIGRAWTAAAAAAAMVSAAAAAAVRARPIELRV